jgi:hypothetical protein
VFTRSFSVPRLVLCQPGSTSAGSGRSNGYDSGKLQAEGRRRFWFVRTIAAFGLDHGCGLVANPFMPMLVANPPRPVKHPIKYASRSFCD